MAVKKHMYMDYQAKRNKATVVWLHGVRLPEQDMREGLFEMGAIL